MDLMSVVFCSVSGQSKSHSGFCNPFIIFKRLIVMHFMRMPLVMFLPLQHGEQALMDTDVLLLCLHHPHALLPHLEDNPENVHNVIFTDPLKVNQSDFFGMIIQIDTTRIQDKDQTWSILSSAMNVPDRPTPALQWTTIGLCSGLTRSLNARTNLQWS